MPEYTTRSPQEVDPLSWFTGPRLPLVLAAAAATLGLLMTVIYWPLWRDAGLLLLALPFYLAAGWITTVATQPHRPAFSHADAALVLCTAAAGLALAGFGTVGSSVPVEQWWPGFSFAAALAGLAPYCSVRRIVAYSVPALGVMGAVAAIVFVRPSSTWSPLGEVSAATAPVLVGAVAASVFSYTVVRRTTEFLERPAATDAAVAAVPTLTPHESSRVARLSARVAEFLGKVADAGVVTDDDRALAAHLSRHLRTELVDAANRSWLDDMALQTGMKVSDPARLATRLNETQRAALRGLLVAAIESPVVESSSVLIELRAHSDGSTAVALSIDVNLPEGRRVMLLAPYYLTLKTTVSNISWSDGRNLVLKFQVPPKP